MPWTYDALPRQTAADVAPCSRHRRCRRAEASRSAPNVRARVPDVAGQAGKAWERPDEVCHPARRLGQQAGKPRPRVPEAPDLARPARKGKPEFRPRIPQVRRRGKPLRKRSRNLRRGIPGAPQPGRQLRKHAASLRPRAPRGGQPAGRAWQPIRQAQEGLPKLRTAARSFPSLPGASGSAPQIPGAGPCAGQAPGPPLAQVRQTSPLSPRPISPKVPPPGVMYAIRPARSPSR